MTGPAAGPTCILSERTARLLAAVRLRLVVRAATASGLVALAALLAILELLAAGLAFGGPGAAGLAESLGRWLPAAALLAATLCLVTLFRRPGRVYLASLVEKAEPALAGQLVTLAELESGRTGGAELPAGALELMAERVDAALGRAELMPRRAAAAEPRRRWPLVPPAAAFAAGLVLVAVGGTRYLEALGELCGIGGAGPTRIAAVDPGDVALDEGEGLAVSCRTAGRAPRSMTLSAGPARIPMRRGDDGLWHAEFTPRGSGSYGVLVESRAGLMEAGPYRVRVRPRPLVWVDKVVYRYPEYTGLAARESDSPEIDCLAGARAELRLKGRGSVGRVELQLEPGGTIAATPGADGSWRATLEVRRVGRYRILVTPPGGGATREVACGTITARADLPPTAAALARRLSDGRVAVDYRVADDYRLGKAKMTFVAGGKRRAYEVPDTAGRGEAQGAVLVPAEVLALAAADGVFRYRLDVVDTHAPEPNRGESPNQEFRVERETSLAGPVLEKPPLQMAGSHERPGSSGDASGASAGGGRPAERPLESLYKPEEGGSKSSSSGSAKQPGDPDDPYLAPSGGGDGDDEPSAEQKQGGEAKPGSGDPGSGDGDGGGQGGVPEQPRVNTPGSGGPGGAGNSGGGESHNSPGGRSTGSGSGGSPGDGGGSQPVDRPPTGSETGMGKRLPEKVIPGRVDMDVKPGERPLAGGPTPPTLRTDWGGVRPADSGMQDAPSMVRAPDGQLGTAGPSAAPPGGQSSGAPISPAAQVAPRYRRYINEYLEAMAAEERR